MDSWREAECKRSHDPFYKYNSHDERNSKAVGDAFIWVHEPVIVGAGPSGLAVAACLMEKGIPSVVLERSDCIASLWKHKTYDRLRLHLPKQFCELPHMSFPTCFPTYPTKHQFLAYLETYARQFNISPVFHQTVECAFYDRDLSMWIVKTRRTDKEGEEEAMTSYICRWLVVATGENADIVVPDIEGIGEFKGPVVHTSEYRRGDVFREKKVLVLGCGNSGMEICLDLCDYNAHPTLVVRDSVHVLPRDILGRSTFGLSMWLLKWLPIRAVDRFLLFVSWLTLGDTSQHGLERPHLGPLELKAVSGKTPVLDVGTLAKIKSGNVKICPAIKRMMSHGAEFIDGRAENFDVVVLATGYRSNVPSWLKERELFSENTGLPRRPFPHSWKGERGLYAVGFTQRGILGASTEARRIAHDIHQQWRCAAKSVGNPLKNSITTAVERDLLHTCTGD
ncbi:unnamed protein product [Spirodela intermedia]|uniref:Flavin-containing monooxygenase n=2 Tax=Spirodela intermedia TaxID=51605 RepID=A0A7I8J6U3_SPIIN|nr:unnamed protein product [Spirodela intermedia]CAA6665968.1 unnamed protein product [Spirodela intermedia]CAA7402726.1 unnamed protein product [Spirodela intermedia]